jgi:hypothetical protein
MKFNSICWIIHFWGTCWIVLVGDPVRKAIPPIDYKNPKLGK